MKSKKNQLSVSRLYLILDKTVCGKRDIETMLKMAAAGGVDLVQIRDKKSSTKEMIGYCSALKKITKKYKIPLIINDRLDVCIALDADGIHVGQDDLPVKTARKILGPSKIIGLSCHTSQDIKSACRENIDYLSFGPVFRTGTKPDLTPKGISDFKKNKKYIKIPAFLIGGINNSNIAELSGLHLTGVAVCSVICNAKAPEESARNLKRKMEKCINN